MADEEHDTAFVVGAILGGLVGGAYVLFNAPQSGAQTRSELAARWNALTGGLASKAAAVDGNVRQVVASAGHAVSPLAERLDRGRAGTAGKATVVETTEGEVATAGAEAVFTLPDPLEPDPVVRDEPVEQATGDSQAAGDQPRSAASAAVELDVVVGGARPTEAQR